MNGRERTLSGLDGVNAAGPLFSPDDLIGGGEVHVARVGDGHSGLSQLIRAGVLGQQGLQFVHGDLHGQANK